jgi:hypothetical protein
MVSRLPFTLRHEAAGSAVATQKDHGYSLECLARLAMTASKPHPYNEAIRRLSSTEAFL